MRAAHALHVFPNAPKLHYALLAASQCGPMHLSIPVRMAAIEPADARGPVVSLSKAEHPADSKSGRVRRKRQRLRSNGLIESAAASKFVALIRDRDAAALPIRC